MGALGEMLTYMEPFVYTLKDCAANMEKIAEAMSG